MFLGRMPIFVGLDNPNSDNTTFDKGVWYINKNIELPYMSMCASDSIPSDTTADVDNETNYDIWSVIDELSS